MDASTGRKANKRKKSTGEYNKYNYKKIKSIYFLEKMYFTLPKKRLLYIIKYNKKTQKLLNMNINDYKKYCETFTPIEIEIIPAKDVYGKFINIDNDKTSFYQIYFNDCKNEIKKYYFTEDDKVKKIKIIINYQIKTFSQLFKECNCIQSIYFRKFYRKNIYDLSKMFFQCILLKDIDFSNFKANNVTNMAEMFFRCSSLKELDLSKFNANNVTNMSKMFSGCLSLNEINLTNFKTNNVTDMSSMFYECFSLKKLDLSNFNTNNMYYKNM